MRVFSLSIIVPFRGQTESFETTLASVLQNRPPQAEVIVAHTGCYGDPWGLGDEVRFVVGPRRSNLARLINTAVDAANGEIVHWLHGGLQVTDGWTDQALEHFADARVASVSPRVAEDHSSNRVVASGVGYSVGGRRRVMSDEPLHGAGAILGPTILAGFYRRSAFTLLDGFDVSLGDRLTDVDLALSLKALGYHSVFESACCLHSESDAEPRLRSRGFRAQRSAERIFWRHAARDGWLKSLAMHPWAVGAEFLADLPSAAALLGLVGRGAAWLELVGPSKRRRQLRDAQRMAQLPGVSDQETASTSRDVDGETDLRAA